jgi:hypothetical protein
MACPAKCSTVVDMVKAYPNPGSVDDSNLMGAGRFPSKADAPTVVDPDTVEAFEVAFEGLETIFRGRP